MRVVKAPAGPGRRIRQKRGHRTYKALVETGFALLEQQEFESITVAELAQKAGYSVGAFYARFHSKDEFLEALIAHHFEERSRARRELIDREPAETLINVVVDDIVTYYWRRRRFWRAALFRSIRDPAFWEPVRRHGHEFADLMIERIERHSGRGLSEAEKLNVRFAFQVTFGTINNAIINRPGPTFIGQSAFVENLARTFRLVSDYDRLTDTATQRRRPARQHRDPQRRGGGDAVRQRRPR